MDLSSVQEIKLGDERAVVVPLETWESLMQALEDVEDAQILEALSSDAEEEELPHDEFLRQLRRCPLRYLRKQRAMTQGELARKAGLSQSFIARVETNEKRLSDSSRKKIAKALGVAEDKLVY